MSDYKVLMHSGTLIDVLEPDPNTILLEDLAYHLEREGRFANAVQEYSVAQHSVVVARLALRLAPTVRDATRIVRAGLFHDAPEAVLRDMPKDVKLAMRALDQSKALAWSAYDHIEDRLMRAISERFGIAWSDDLQALIKRADEAALAAEVHVLWPKRLQQHFGCDDPMPEAIALVEEARETPFGIFVHAAASCAYGLSPGMLGASCEQ